MRNFPAALRTSSQRPRSAVSASWKRASRRRIGSAAAPTTASYAGAANHHSSAPTSAPAKNLSPLRSMHARRPDVEERDGGAADDGLPDREVEELEEVGLVAIDEEERHDAREVQDLDHADRGGEADQALPPRRGKRQDRRDEEDDRLDAVAAVLDRDGVAAGGEDHANHGDMLAERVEQRGRHDGDGPAERHDHRGVDRLQRQREVEHREQDDEADEEASGLHGLTRGQGADGGR